MLAMRVVVSLHACIMHTVLVCAVNGTDNVLHSRCAVRGIVGTVRLAPGPNGVLCPVV